MITLLAFNFAVLFVAMMVLWRVSVAIRDVSFIDAVWAYGMVGLAVVSFLHAPHHGPGQWLLLGLTALWGMRLGTHLLLRWRRLGSDPRYDRIVGAAEAKGRSFSMAALTLVFLPQTVLLWFTSLPAQAGILSAPPNMPGIIGLVGAALALFGIAFETIGDLQLEAFRSDPANKGAVMDRGLWRFTRHPNYFGDACAWWGIWIVAVDAGAWWTILSPVFLTWTLMKWSGAALLERGLKKSRPGYADYVARTSGFFPLPPKR
jgi:steroid 5-alpha reductase family enzyme